MKCCIQNKGREFFLFNNTFNTFYLQLNVITQIPFFPVRDLFNALSNIHDSIYHSFCYTSCGALDSLYKRSHDALQCNKQQPMASRLKVGVCVRVHVHIHAHMVLSYYYEILVTLKFNKFLISGILGT